MQAECARGDVGTVVLTTGSTGLGAIDRVDEALALRERYGVRLHADGAYGGFFTLLARGDDPLVSPAPYAAIAQCDSVVVDPHKHGLQPYGCGAVLFADPAVQRVYRHDSPFTYFTEADLHLGEISLECSRAGAAAAGLWLTLQALPLERDEGLGAVLAAGRRAALDWAARLRSSEVLDLHVEPELDIVTYLPRVGSLSALDAASGAVLKAGMEDADDPVFLSTLYLGARRAGRAPPRPRGRRRRRARAAQRPDEARARAGGAVAARARRGPDPRRAGMTTRGLVALGDSITNGHGEPALGVPMQSWAQWLAEALALPFTKLARDAALARDVLAEQVPRLDGPYDVACLYVGVNDARSPEWDPAAYERALRASVAALAACSERLLLCTLPADLGRPRAAPKPARGERHRPRRRRRERRRARRARRPRRAAVAAARRRPPDRRAASSRSPTARRAPWAPRTCPPRSSRSTAHAAPARASPPAGA